VSGCNPENERIKRRYYVHMREADGLSEKTVEHAGWAIADFEKFTNWRSFKRFSSKDATAFKSDLLSKSRSRSVGSNRRTTIHSKLMRLEGFFRWLAEQPGYRKAFTIGDTKYFKMPRRDRQIVSDQEPKPAPTLQQMQKVVRTMPASTDVELRNRALMACLLLTGARVSALITLKLRHVTRNGTGIIQDAREVATKGGRTFRTYFFPVGEDIKAMFLSYVDHLRLSLDWGDDDPLFPATRQAVGEDHQFSVVGLARKHWKTPDPVRDVFRAACDAVGIPPYTPHAVRRTLVRFGQETCPTARDFVAWSQNLGHREVLTTFTSYGRLSELEREQILGGLGERKTDVAPELISQLTKAVLSALDASSPCASSFEATAP